MYLLPPGTPRDKYRFCYKLVPFLRRTFLRIFCKFLAFCLHSVQRGAFSSCISQRIFVLLERIFAHFKALCCILSASTLLCLGVHLLCIHDAPFLDQCLMCILLHSCILYSMTFLRILTHSERLLRILGCMGGCSGEAPRHARPGMTAGICIFFRVAFGCILCAFCTHLRASRTSSSDILSHFECIPPHSEPSAALALSSVHS